MTTLMPCEAIVERLKPMRFQPVVRLEPVTRPHALLDTKFGGPYHVPAGKNPPRNLRTGAELFLLAQINFDQIPHTGEFPEHGILQFFLDPDPVQFRANAHPTDQIAWRIRYIPNTVSYADIDPAGYMPSYASGITTLPFPPEKYLPMAASNYLQLCAWEDFPFRAMLRRYCADIVDLNDLMTEALAVQAGAMLARDFKPGKQDDKVPQIGGYPTFSRNDPRAVDPGTGLRVPTVCLLQIPCFDGCNWGSDNIVHFFISQKDLRNCDFNHVLLDMSW